MTADGTGPTGMSPLTRLHTRSLPLDLIIGRLFGAGLLIWMAWIHWHLWSNGYKHLHIVGPRFLLKAIAGVLMALAVIGVPTRCLSPTAAGGALLAGGTLVGLAISINIGLFGFEDYLNAPFARLSVWVESAAFVGLVGQDLGGAFTGQGTDPGSAPLLILMAVAMWPAPVRASASAAPGAVAPATPLDSARRHNGPALPAATASA
jgi:hypothetical protein